jgi:hypothetical protein
VLGERKELIFLHDFLFATNFKTARELEAINQVFLTGFWL